MKIKISCDSTCDLTQELYSQYGISVVPLHVEKEGRMYSDGVDITSVDILNYMVKDNGMCSTSAVNVSEYEGYFKEYLKNNDAVIHINISSKFSSCFQNAKLAAASMRNVYVVDSYNLSSGSGHLAIDAALLAESGMDPAMIYATLKEKAKKLDVSFVIDTLKYLHKGGRCSGVAALGANLLKLKPCIEVIDGAMSVGKKYRGLIDKVLPLYVDDRLKGRTDLDLRRIFITCTADTPQETIDAVQERILINQPFEKILVTRAGCTVTCHCGTRTLGILFYKK